MKKQASIKTLLKHATDVFNAYIRERDKDEGCISCGTFKMIQAGHLYSAGKFPALRFNEDNVNSQCLPCNYYRSGDLLNYRNNLIKKIGLERVEKLELIAAQSKRQPFKWNRFHLQEIINKYK